MIGTRDLWYGPSNVTTATSQSYAANSTLLCCFDAIGNVLGNIKNN